MRIVKGAQNHILDIEQKINANKQQPRRAAQPEYDPPVRQPAPLAPEPEAPRQPTKAELLEQEREDRKKKWHEERAQMKKDI